MPNNCFDCSKEISIIIVVQLFINMHKIHFDTKRPNKMFVFLFFSASFFFCLKICIAINLKHFNLWNFIWIHTISYTANKNRFYSHSTMDFWYFILFIDAHHLYMHAFVWFKSAFPVRLIVWRKTNIGFRGPQSNDMDMAFGRKTFEKLLIHRIKK